MLTDNAQAAERRRFSVLLDRAEGATSMADGQLELMMHRRLATGCRWGMCEDGEKAGLNDTLVPTAAIPIENLYCSCRLTSHAAGRGGHGQALALGRFGGAQPSARLSFCRHPLSIHIETPAKGRGGCSRVTVSPTAQVAADGASAAVTRTRARQLNYPPSVLIGTQQVSRRALQLRPPWRIPTAAVS